MGEEDAEEIFRGKTDMEDGGEKKEIKSKRVVTMWIRGCNI
jgi:hypothetical protein